MFKWIYNKREGYYYAEHNSTIRANRINGELAVYSGGGSKTEVYQPTPPPQPSTADAISAWVESMPQVYETQMQYAPLQAAQQVGLAEQFAAPMGQAIQKAQSAMHPETTALQEQLAAQASEGAAGNVPDWAREQYRSDLAGGLGYNVGSGIGSDYMSRGMMEQQQQYQQRSQDMALSLMGRQPLSQPAMPQTGQYSQQFTPQNTMGFMGETYAPFAQASRPMPLQHGDQSFLWGLYRG
jgi:hypothetical protein